MILLCKPCDVTWSDEVGRECWCCETDTDVVPRIETHARMGLSRDAEVDAHDLMFTG